MTIISAGVRVPMNSRDVDSSNAASPGRWLVTGQVDRTSRFLVSITWSLLAMETKTKSVFPALSSKSSEGLPQSKTGDGWCFHRRDLVNLRIDRSLDPRNKVGDC